MSYRIFVEFWMKFYCLWFFIDDCDLFISDDGCFSVPFWKV